MRIHEPIPHWNNFTVPELKEIMGHCDALKKLGIAQDDKMLASIERDIDLREKDVSHRHEHGISKTTKTRQLLVQNGSKPQIVIPKMNEPIKQPTQDYLLEQTA